MLHRLFIVLLLLIGAVPVSFAASEPTLTVQAVARPAGSVPLGAQRVTMLTVQFSASCGQDIPLTSLTLRHRGLGDPADVLRVYAVFDRVRQTRSVGLTGREGTGTLRLRGVTVPSCGTLSLDINADFSADAASSGQHGLEIESAEAVGTDVPVRVILNRAGTLALTTPVGRIAGTVRAELLSIPGTLTYGSARTVARVRLKADSRQDQAISAITFTNTGTARNDDLQNFILETSGHTRLSATVTTLDGDRVRVVLDPPLVMRRNEQRLVHLLADIRASRRKTVGFTIQEPSDVEAASVR